MAFECSRPARDRAAITEGAVRQGCAGWQFRSAGERAPLETRAGRTGPSSFTFHNRLMAVRLDASRVVHVRVVARGG